MTTLKNVLIAIIAAVLLFGPIVAALATDEPRWLFVSLVVLILALAG